MELFENLAEVGLTTGILQIIIVAAIAIFLVGMYWRFIVTGIGILFCVVVFAMPAKKDVQSIEVAKAQTNKDEPKWEEIKPEPPVVTVNPDTKPKNDQESFMEDCRVYGNLTQSQCGALWRDRVNNVEPVKWRNQWKNSQTLKVKHGTI
jgi:hypothetical protein